MSETTVGHYMTKAVNRVAPECTISDALEKLQARNTSCLIICNEDIPVGILTERDVVKIAVRQVSGETDIDQPVSKVMSWPIIKIKASDPIDLATRLSKEKKIRHFPVVDEGGKLAGLLTQMDLIRATSAMLEENTSQAPHR